MNRRGFVGLLTGVATALVVPELLVPEKKFFLPPRGGWPSMAGYTPLEKWAIKQHHSLVLWMNSEPGKPDVELAPEYGPNTYILRGPFQGLAKITGPTMVVPIPSSSLHG